MLNVAEACLCAKISQSKSRTKFKEAVEKLRFKDALNPEQLSLS